ncbi:MAG: glycosyltransferase family 4 protein [Candidatus Hadarchaeota archaeon]|nr:glycosyltransferase family 4 protein [Candidatus Hadarchaeota archaeon]
MKKKISLCVSSQTPYVRFKVSSEDLYDKYGDIPEPLPLDMLTESEDFVYAPGGVTRLIPPLLRALYKRKLIEKPHWVSLNPLGPEKAVSGGMILHSVEMSPRESTRYGRFKEALWKNIHGVEQTPIPKDYFPGYALFNWLVAKKMLDLHDEYDFDLFYVHDFQLLLAGSMLGPTAPRVFRWHIPIDMQEMLPSWRSLLLRYMEDYDVVITGCKKYKESLLKSGFRGKVHQQYPHINPEDYDRPSYSEMNQFCQKYGIGEDDEVILVVARLDPMKGQDVAIKGLAHIARSFPNLKLVLIGDGSFSSSRRGGLGLPKGLRWKKELDKLSKSLGVSDRVIFTGYVPKEELESAYLRANVVVLPSVLEGFGLVVLEGWQYKNPVIVSSEAGVAELVEDGVNSYVFDPSNPRELGEKIKTILSKPKLASEIAERGHETVKQCYLERNVDRIWSLFMEILEG